VEFVTHSYMGIVTCKSVKFVTHSYTGIVTHYIRGSFRMRGVLMKTYSGYSKDAGLTIFTPANSFLAVVRSLNSVHFFFLSFFLSFCLSILQS